MKGKHKKVLQNIFETPVNSSIVWKDIEALFIALGAEISEGAEQRVGFRRTIARQRCVIPQNDQYRSVGA